jgi:hypothetical protein
MAKKTETPANSDHVSNLVMKKLGTPPDHFATQSVNIFNNYWRVNVRVKISDNKMITTTSISDSFLVKIEGNKITDGDLIENKYKN